MFKELLLWLATFTFGVVVGTMMATIMLVCTLWFEGAVR